MEVGVDYLWPFHNDSTMNVLILRLSILPSINSFALLNENFESFEIVNFFLNNFNFLFIAELAKINNHKCFCQGQLQGSLN